MEQISRPIFQCHLINSSTRKDKLKQHVQTVHEKLRYHCSLCNHQVTRRDKLNEHMQVVHQGLKFKCDVCNEEYNRPAALKKHKKIHVDFEFLINTN